MLRPLGVAFALIRIPHLAVSLFLFPVVSSLILVFGQIVITGALINSVSQVLPDVSPKPFDKQPEFNAVRFLLYGSGERRSPLKVCRWGRDPRGFSKEFIVTPGCQADSLDLALNVSNPTTFPVEKYVELFEGQIDRLHVCESCAPSAVIAIDSDGNPTSKALNVYGLGVLSLSLQGKQFLRDERLDNVRMIKDSLGSLLFFVPESEYFVDMSPSNGIITFTFNVVPLILITLWLSVRAHRLVLEYFSKNDVLLPLVAATGRNVFYSSLWILTILRVGCFLVAALPLLYFGLKDIGGDTVFADLAPVLPRLLAWLAALVGAAAPSTIISSIADLQHRRPIRGLLYRFGPLVIAFMGVTMWAGSFFLPSTLMEVFRSVIIALPIVGFGPLLFGAISQTPVVLMMTHLALALGLLFVIIKSNQRWFAAHLEEI